MATQQHAEHVGSLLRPAWLLEARAAHKAGTRSAEELAELADRAVLDAISLQQQAGIEVFTDGEMRRENWMAGLLECTGGVVSYDRPSVAWHRGGEIVSGPDTDFETVAASEKVTRKEARTSVEAAFLARHAPRAFKITMMSASMGGLMWRPEISARVYPDPADLVADLVALQIQEIEQLIDQGVRWVQLDSLGYNQVFDPGFRAQTGLSALSPELILDATVTADAQIVGAAKRKDPDVTVGMHICRGNNRSAWMAQGGYEQVAERLFGEVGADRFLLEYDTERAGGFEPLRFVRPGTTVVLGLISSKVPELESQDELRRRIDQAARYVPVADLALSPQCGFASTSRGNQLTSDDQRRKLELVVSVAGKVWG